MNRMRLLLAAGVSCLLQTVAGAQPVGPLYAPPSTGVSGAGNSHLSSRSGDGRFLVFLSQANNLVTNDTLAPFVDVFVRDLVEHRTALVSVNHSGVGGGDDNSGFPSISANGRFVAFASAASNLVNDDTNQAMDIFLRDLGDQTTLLVSVDVAGSGVALGPSQLANNLPLSSRPSVSADGGRVVFESRATNLIALTDSNGAADVFLRDLQSGQTLLVSVNLPGTGSGSGRSDSAQLSADGRRVAFASTATDLVEDVSSALGEIYVRDLQSNVTVWASRDAGSYLGEAPRCSNPVLSADGGAVVFTARGAATEPVLLCRHNLRTGQTTVITSNAVAQATAALSDDGRWVAFEASRGVSAANTNVVVRLWDAETGIAQAVSVDSSGQPMGPSWAPAIGGDGQQVAFLSSAPLTPQATGGFFQVFIRDMVEEVTRWVSANRLGLPSGGHFDVATPVIAPDGRSVAFESDAADLVDEDLNLARDVFLCHLDTETTELVSVRHADLPARVGAGPSFVSRNGISINGRFVLFRTLDHNLVASDTNRTASGVVHDNWSKTNMPVRVAGLVLDAVLSGAGGHVACTLIPSGSVPQVYRFDLLTGQSELVSANLNNLEANGHSGNPSISLDGNLVAFEGNSSDLVPGGRGYTHVYLRDMIARTNFWVNNVAPAGGTLTVTPPASHPLLSLDSRWVLFESENQLRARDLVRGGLVQLSVGGAGTNLPGVSNGAVISSDSKKVAFVNSGNTTYLYDLETKTHRLVCVGCTRPALNADGNLLVYQGLDSGSTTQVFLRNLTNDTTQLISTAAVGSVPGNSHSTAPVVSSDGRFVVFLSGASDLVAGDDDDRTDLFLRDIVTQTTLLLTPGSELFPPGRDLFSPPVMAAYSPTVVFQCYAGNLVPGDFNDTADVFLLQLGLGDSDQDGLGDSWELTYFGDLSRDGHGDFDLDGHTDIQEFNSGTNPLDDASILHVTSVRRVGDGKVLLLWAATGGKTYRVQYKDSVDESEWRDLPGLVTAASATAVALDQSVSATGRRFYRVAQVW